MRTHYIGHDQSYQKKRAANQAGWDPADITEEVIQQFLPWLNHEAIQSNGKLLELGCGAGNLSVAFARAGFCVTGLDISPTAIDWAIQRAKDEDLQIDFQLANLSEELRLNSKFDLVIDSHCLHCIIGQDRQTFLKNAYQASKSGGILIVNTMVQNQNTHQLNGYDPKTGQVIINDIITRYIGPYEKLLEEITTAGFKIIEYDVDQNSSDNITDDLIVLAQKVL